MKPFDEYKDMRAVYADTLVELAAEDPNILVLEADLMAASGTKAFRDAYPDRLLNAGIAEANMVGVASGLSSMGFIPFANTFASFAGRRDFDQFFLSANYAGQNVKLVGSDPGITAQFNGGTHMPFEDIVLMRAVPGLVLVEPSDAVSMHAITRLLAEHKGSTYMRLQRKGAVTRYKADQKFELGKGIVLSEGDDAAIFASGMVMVNEAVEAAKLLKEKGISAAVIDIHTIKPLDADLVLEMAEHTGAIVTAENGQRSGGLGAAVAELIGENIPTPVVRVGVKDLFGEVGTLDYLKKRFELTAEDIVSAVERALFLKKKH
ncbi:transketolase family protein [Sediminispirochaeta smaragdinae]|jgi:transketolase|uniref:Transketolase domain protein n=1 Tax=Sediminispirochaeta smaragdinae (strain DSM 11293 / JCM 15392 / SEBR 4228) TaxID=573413 RepID=E1R3X2_SEDSS|nr:transketolase C-terminal domain-containing protein [Sediminispirochaeta smaragdinae]ADK82093.1 Transketolase domain protein [Sediminispirochaeta smaragdinae DSM 11293]